MLIKGLAHDPGVPLGGLMKGEASGGIGLRADAQVDRVPLGVAAVEVAEKRDAPAAPGAGPEALGDEGGDRRVLAGEEGADLPQRDVEAEADLVVGVHGRG
jgi:hypothetical protein